MYPEVGASNVQAPSTLTCLNVAHRWCYNYKALCNMPPADARYAPLVDVLQGISSLRRLSCQVRAPTPCAASAWRSSVPLCKCHHCACTRAGVIVLLMHSPQ